MSQESPTQSAPPSGPTQITPVGKGLIALLIVGVIAAVGFHFRTDVQNFAENHRSNQPQAQVAVQGQTQGPGSNETEYGTKEHPLTVSLVSFSGYAPALLAAGNSLETQPGSIFDQEGTNIKFVIQDDIPTLATTFGSGTAQCSWRTLDFHAQEGPNAVGAGFDPRAVMVVDNSRGADSVIAGPGIQKIEDLVGKKVALLQYTPSHGLIQEAINNSALTTRQKQSIKLVFVSAEGGTAAVRSSFISGSVDAAVLWDPDLSLALKAVPNSHSVISTKTLSDTIYDVIVCDKRVIKSSPKAVQGLVSGWLKGVDIANHNPTSAANALVKNEPFFAQLEQQEGAGFTRSLLPNIAFTNIADNARIFGLANSSEGQSTYDRVYTTFDQLYREAGALANPNSPRIPPQNSVDLQFVQKIVNSDPAILAQASKPEFNFTQADTAKASTSDPVLTKSVSIDFDTGSATLTPKARHVIDSQLIPLLREAGAAPVRIEGNTDSRGNRASNVSLSLRRADAVATYLSGDWGFSVQRFSAKGNGSNKPTCNEASPTDDFVPTVEACQALNRQTHVAIIPVK